MQSADNGAMVVQDVHQASREARQALRTVNQVLAGSYDDDTIDQSKTSLHVATTHYYVTLRPWAITSAYYWDEVPLYKDDDGDWIKGLKNLDPWVYSVEKQEIRSEDAVEGESIKTEEVSRIMPPEIAARAVMVLDQLFRDSPFSPGQGAAPERKRIDQSQVETNDAEPDVAVSDE
ncbi:hypothetical protein D8Y22_12755 [Salinadaptatus halalkaliphilus]|uniref:Uncharacterized protein n=1 Tax=Salinadaptatus halalkaliphilus TaxID=2419781 RepID=A0A4V3VL74_9EURY|nr:hypothetical protein [Salinadaptatus halalkaliphilus]THE64507.1 hypothetical protein D8Y22_12755 [Salinadaptatus halalkaliphilus]